MKDTRYTALAKQLVNYSCHLLPGEKLLLEVTGLEENLAKEIIREVYAAGGQPFLLLNNERLQKEWLTGLGGIKAEALDMQARWDTERMAEMDAYIGLRVKENLFDMSTVPDEVNNLYNRHYLRPVHYDLRVPKTKWVVLRYPNASMAQEANMSTEDFEDFYFNVCNIDYARMSAAMDPLLQLLQNADKVAIRGAGVNLNFSIKGIDAVKCDGQYNIPDGEVYTAPVKNSVEGWITFNTPTVFQGKVFQNVNLLFEKGKIVSAEAAANSAALKAIFDTDEGARYLGEFAFGVNPLILTPINDVLFDEKICGSFHITPGNCYAEANNGNKSSIHWDLVYIMRPEYGGGEIFIDGELIQKDGLFIPERLQSLNPERILAP